MAVFCSSACHPGHVYLGVPVRNVPAAALLGDCG